MRLSVVMDQEILPRKPFLWWLTTQGRGAHAAAAHRAQRRLPLNRFRHVIATAQEIAEVNPRGLIDLLRAVLRPMQSEYLLGVAELGQDAVSDIDADVFFGKAAADRIYGPDGKTPRGVELDPSHFRLQLARDILLPWAWDQQRYVNALATIGAGKCDPENMNVRHQGAWKMDAFNHMVTLWVPWGIGFVGGGNHSITAGILAAEGELIPTEAYDMGYLLDEVHCDGRHYIETSTGRHVDKVTCHRRAAAFELGRLMRDTGFPAFREVSARAKLST